MRIFQVSCNLDDWCSHTLYYKMRTERTRKVTETILESRKMDESYYRRVLPIKTELDPRTELLEPRPHTTRFFEKGYALNRAPGFQSMPHPFKSSHKSVLRLSPAPYNLSDLSTFFIVGTSGNT